MPSSAYPMIPVDTALGIVLSQTMATATDTELMSITKARGLILAEDIIADHPIPRFRTSILDGYAVCAPLSAGVYPLQGRVHAGSAVTEPLCKDHVQYITTGGAVPPGANVILRVEDTDIVDLDPSKVLIRVDVSTKTSNIREVGSDISENELILKSGHPLGPAEIGLLCSIGRTEVFCHRLPTVGVMSTGDELVSAWEVPTGSQIRDSNRAALISALDDVIMFSLSL